MARIVFDLDGTLIDSAPDIHGIANALLAKEGAELISLEQTRDFIGNGACVFVARMRAARDIPETEHERLLAEFMSLYDDAVSLTVPYPGVEVTLQALVEASHSLGICTNKPLRPCKAVLSHFGLDQYFSTIWGGDSLPTHKPHPDPLLAALSELEDGTALYVGDSEIDAETARRANVPFLLFTEGYRKCPTEALPHTASFSNFNALPSIIEDLLATSKA